MACIHLKNFKVFVSPRRPETHFRNAQGHQRAVGINGSIYMFQSTVFTVYEVESQKTVNTKPGKGTSERVLPQLPRKVGWKTQKDRK